MSPMDPQRYPVALSSWAVHKAIGFEVEDDAIKGPQPYWKVGDSPIDIRELPALTASHGIHRLELCHFHLDRRDPSVVNDLRRSLDAANVTLQTLLIDAGDLTHPDPAIAEKHEAWIASWLETAAALGAERARVVAGRTRREGDIEDSAPRLRRLAAGTSVRITTENWLAVLDEPDRTNRLLDLCEGEIGLNVDLGNWTGEQKYDWIAKIAGRAETCHAKCEIDHNGNLDTHDFGRAIDAAVGAGYSGPWTLVNGGGADREWEFVKLQAGFIASR